MVVVETHRIKERRLQQFCAAGECVLEDMDEGQKQPGHGVPRDSELVCQPCCFLSKYIS
jgi:hypothetical protein